MYKILIIISLSCQSILAWTQSEPGNKTYSLPKVKPLPETKPKPLPALGQPFELSSVEQEPEFPGGMSALYQWINNNFVYPDSARAYKIEGRVVASFIIEKDGSITNIEILRTLGGGCAEEVIRLVKMMPQWIPGKHHGEIVRVRYTLHFKVSG